MIHKYEINNIWN